MVMNLSKKVFPGAVLVLFLIPLPLFAAASDYKFGLLKVESFAYKFTDVTVKLTHTPDGKLIPKAVISEIKAHMHTSDKIITGQTLLPTTLDAPGTYHIRINTSTAGTWVLSLAAKVPGEAEIVRGTVNFEAS